MSDKPTFILDEEALNLPSKPLPYTLLHTKSKKDGKTRFIMPDTYPKFETEFFDVIHSCAGYIDKLKTIEQRIEMNTRLNKVFVARHKASAMRLFRDLINLLSQKEGDSNGKS